MEDLRVTRWKIGSCNIISKGLYLFSFISSGSFKIFIPEALVFFNQHLVSDQILGVTYLIYLHCQKPETRWGSSVMS